MTPHPEPHDRRERPPLTLASRRPRRGWGARALGTVPGLLLTLAMLGFPLGTGRLGSRLLRAAHERDALRDERVRFATPPAPRPDAPTPAPPAETATPRAAPTPSAPAATAPAAGTPPAPGTPGSVTVSAPDTGAAPGSRLRAAERAAVRATAGAPTGEPAAPAAVPGRVGASLVGPPLTAAQRDSLLAVPPPVRPLFPVRTDLGRALAGSAPGELTAAQRGDMSRSLIATDLARTTWNPCAYSPGAQMPGGRSANDMRVQACGSAAGARVAVGLPGGGPSGRQRARDAAVHAENLRILARIRDQKRRRTDSLSWIAESTRAARDSGSRAPATPPDRPSG